MKTITVLFVAIMLLGAIEAKKNHRRHAKINSNKILAKSASSAHLAEMGKVAIAARMTGA